MKDCAVSQIWFSETYTVPAEQTSQRMFGVLPHGKSYSDRLLNAMSNGYLIAVLESICAREMQKYVDHDRELVIGAEVRCQHRAPVPAGALVTVDGWITTIGGNEATFFVRASDEQEVVCEGEIRFSVEQRAQLERKIQRKCEAIERRKSFAAA
jgi:fluoroacetyl-CoA thioesterase